MAAADNCPDDAEEDERERRAAGGDMDRELPAATRLDDQVGADAERQQPVKKAGGKVPDRYVFHDHRPLQRAEELTPSLKTRCRRRPPARRSCRRGYGCGGR